MKHNIGPFLTCLITAAITCDVSAQNHNLFVSDPFYGSIYKITPAGAQSTFASGLFYPWGLAFQPVPEPSTLSLLGMTMFGIGLVRRHRS
jgi:hypothetical protein